MSSEYWDKLKHPEWQRKRLKVMERESFKCEHCGSKDNTLNVHHSYYEKGKDPWEYPEYSLHCLCEKCHAEWHKQKRDADELIANLRADQIKGLCRFLEACHYSAIDWKAFDAGDIKMRFHLMKMTMQHLEKSVFDNFGCIR